MIAFLADAFIKATVLLLLAAGASVLLRRAAAAYRHLVWLIACAGVLVLPVASALVPAVTVRAWPRLDVPALAFDAEQIAGAALDAAPLPVTTVDHRAAPTPNTVPTPAASPTDQVRWRLRTDWRTLLVPVWLGGAALVLLTLGVGLARLAWLGRMAEPVREQRWLSLARALTRDIGVGRAVRLLRAAGPAMPMTWGVRRPVILLPAEADGWPDERRRDVLLHEIAHIQRHDFLTQLIARVACAVYWFHPLVWLAVTRLRVERERACDDHVLRAGTRPSEYATHLLDIARTLRPAAATSLASVAMARPAQLATRLLDVLDVNRRRDRVSARAAAPAWIAAVAVVLPLAALAPRVAEPAARGGVGGVGGVGGAAVSVDTLPRVPSPVLIVPPRRDAGTVTARARGDTLRECSSNDASRHSSHYNIDDDKMTIMTTVGRCTVRLAAEGKFTFTEDFTDIASVAAGKQLVIEVDYGRTDRRLTLRSENGTLVRTMRVDGDVRPFDAEAKAWLAETLTFLLRRTGYAGAERARWILEKRGVQALLDEIAQLGGDYARRIYYQAALESGKLDVAGYERLITEAGQSIDSDYELAELLIAVAKAQPLTERMQAGFVAAAKTIGSDYERRRVLQAALSRPGLTPSVQNSMLDAAAGIASDYELATLLIELNDARRVDDAVRPAFFKAANSLQSDYEHRRVLTAILDQSGASRAMLGDVLASARTISSDYELAELLTEVADAGVLDETLRPAFFAAAGTISSDYEHGRALKSLLAHGNLPLPVATAIVESARGIASDHELAEVLIAVIEKVKPDAALQAAIRAAVGTLQSQYERGRVLDALNQRIGRAELE